MSLATVLIAKKSEKAITQNKHFFSLQSGASFWNEGFGSTQPERAPFEQSILSYHAKAIYIYIFKNDFTFLTGFEYQKLENRFDWTNILENHTITKENLVLEVRNNVLTDKQSEVRGDSVFTVKAERVVRNYNQTELYQIPIGIGKTGNYKNWRTDLAIGASINVLSANKGATLYQGQMLEYEGASTDFLNNQMKIHAFLSGSVSYKINGSFGLMTSFQFQKSLSNWSTEQNVTMRPEIFNLNIGVNWTLK